MKRPLLKILPGVAVVLLSPSCSKDDDNAVEDNNATVVAEKPTENQVFYLKVRNASPLSKMFVDPGLGTAGEKTLKFEKGDKLTLKFKFDVQVYDEESGFYRDRQVEASTEASFGDEGFEVYMNQISYDYWWSDVTDELCAQYVKVALEDMQNNPEVAAWQHNVELFWGKESVNSTLSDEKYVQCNDQKEMLDKAPRYAYESFTLEINGSYCFIVFESTSTRDVTIEIEEDGEKKDISLDKSKCYIVSTSAVVKLNKVQKVLNPGMIYYVKTNVED